MVENETGLGSRGLASQLRSIKKRTQQNQMSIIQYCINTTNTSTNNRAVQHTLCFSL